MNIEDIIKENTAALNANTEALLKVLAASGSTTIAPAIVVSTATAEVKKETKKPAAPKASKVEVVEAAPAPAPEPEPTPEPEQPAPAAEPEPQPEPEQPAASGPIDRDELILEANTLVKTWLQKAGPNMAACVAQYTEMRNAWGIAKVTDLPDEKLPGFLDAIRTMVK